MDVCSWSRLGEQHVLHGDSSEGTAMLPAHCVCEMTEPDGVDHRSFHECCLIVSKPMPEDFNPRLPSRQSDLSYALHLLRLVSLGEMDERAVAHTLSDIERAIVA